MTKPLIQQRHDEAVDTLTTRDHYRDAAVRLAAKRELLAEIAEAADRFRQSPLWQSPFAFALVEVRDKYASKPGGGT